MGVIVITSFNMAADCAGQERIAVGDGYGGCERQAELQVLPSLPTGNEQSFTTASFRPDDRLQPGMTRMIDQASGVRFSVTAAPGPGIEALPGSVSPGAARLHEPVLTGAYMNRKLRAVRRLARA